MIKKILCSILLLSALFALDSQNNYLTYPKFWNLYNGGYATERGQPALYKAPQDQAAWKATMKLNTYKVISSFVGKTLYFITETTGDKVARLGPTFYVIKDQKEYIIWWDEKKIVDPAKIQRRYISFNGDQDGLISGALEIPATDKGYYYCQPPSGAAAYLITDTTPIALDDIRKGLRTDWQHDIPGAYEISGTEKFPGKSGRVIFTRFYLGGTPLQEVLLSERDSWLAKLSKKEQEILATQFGLNLVFAKDKLQENQYVASSEKIAEIKDYYEKNQSNFSTNYYYSAKNYLPSGDNPLLWVNEAKDQTTEVAVKNGKYQILKKLNPNSWFITKIGQIQDQQKLKELRGPVRISAEFTADELRRGYFEWQSVYLDIIQKDNKGKVLSTQALRLPASSTEELNLTGIFENEFILSEKAYTLDIYLKIAGCPTDDKEKQGATLKKMSLSKVLLSKPESKLDLAKMFESAPARPLERIKQGDKEYLQFKSAGTGLFIGDRKLTIDPKKRQISFALQSAEEYSGFYSNIFDVRKLSELELAAFFDGDLKKNGDVPEWATTTVELNYYDSDGNQVYPADYGADRYQKLFYTKSDGPQTAKSFFSVPQQRGARYAQLKIHFLRAFDEKLNKTNTTDYYTGEASASFITARPALNLPQNKNFAADGSFYKHINGLPISWSVKGVRVDEDISTQKRTVVFENTQDNWSSLKAEYAVPDKATALRGLMNVEISNIETGLGVWEGFGLFLEADVADQQGNIFHYTGIPVYQKLDNKLVRLERLPLPRQGIIEYYVPLQHEHLKIKKLLWQLALYGKGKVTLHPLDKALNADIIKLEFLTDGASANNPALWAQYGLYSADNSGFTFQKSYELRTNGETRYYSFAETMLEHLQGALRKELDLSAVKNLAVNEELKYDDLTIKALPSYARVEKELSVEADMRYLQIGFTLSSGDRAARYNFKTYLLDGDGNTLEIPIIRKSGLNKWQKIAADQDIFDLKEGREEFIVPVRKRDFNTAAVRLVFGSNQGEITFSDLKIYSVQNMPVQFTADSVAEQYTFLASSAKNRLIYEQKPLTSEALFPLPAENMAALDNREFEAVDPRPFEPAININDLPELKALDAAIRASIKNGKVFCRNGQWYYAENKPFTPVGFTIVGETFNKWIDLRRKEFDSGNRSPYWAKYLDNAERAKLQKTSNYAEYLALFFGAQAKLWQRAGYNIIRVHQLHTTWSGLDTAKLEITYAALKQLQGSGFLIDFDLLPNPDFTNPYFAKIHTKRYVNELTNTTDLYKATLVLPEVKNNYVLPAIEQITSDLKKINFWPNSISYCNETGFTHGFWTIDKNNPQHFPYFNRLYSYYYEKFSQNIAAQPELISFMEEGQGLVKKHIQITKAKTLTNELGAISEMIQQRERVKDNAAYVYYNLLRDEVLNTYPLFKNELSAIKNNGFKNLTERPANLSYYQDINKQLKVIKDNLAILQKNITLAEQENIKELERLCRRPDIVQKLNSFYTALTAQEMPDNFEPAGSTNFEYIDTFGELSAAQLKQTFFTSFVMSVGFQNEINNYLVKLGKGASIGLNNDFTKDTQAILANTYIFLNSADQELRFNKYTHHPVGGHNMLLHSGYGNIFDEDSAIAYNLDLFTPLNAKYPVRLSESNFTYAGGDNSGEGSWSIADWLALSGDKDQVLAFQMGRNNIDNQVITDYFDIGNRVFKLNALNLAAVTALARYANKDFAAPEFKRNVFKHNILDKNSKLNFIAGTAAEQGIDFGNAYLKFKNTGQRKKVDLAIAKIELDKVAYVMMFGMDRNNRQENRPGNPDLVQSFGSAPLIFQKFYGILSVKTAKPVRSIFAITPAGEQHRLPESAYGNLNGYLIINTAKTHKKAVAYKINY